MLKKLNNYHIQFFLFSRSKSCDSYHVFQNVENLVMEFVLEARSRQVQILEKKNKETPEMPQVFVFCKLLGIILLNCINNTFLFCRFIRQL